MSLSPMRWFFPLADSDRRAKRRAGKRRRHDVRRTERLEARLLLTGPTVATQAATSILATAATLHGSVNAQGQTADVTFQYSTSPYFTPTVQTTFATGFNFPGGVAVDAAGDVFVADSNNNVVKKILPDGSVQTIGSGFDIPAGVAVDAAGDVFVADSGNNAVKKILPNGDIQTLGPGFHIPAGVAVDATGDVFVAEFLMNIAVKEIPAGGGAIQTLGSGFNAPYGVAVDGAGDVFVADFIKNAVEKILPNGDIKTLGSGFSGPHGVAVDAAGDVFVADSGNDAVKEILPDGRVQTLGSGFSDPLGVAVDAAGNLFVADGHNNRIVKLSPTSLAAAPSQVSGSTTTAVAANLTGLTPGTTYFYRTVASSSGVGMAADSQQPPQSFTTPLMDVATQAATTIAATGATLHGSVNAQGQTAAVTFQYSTSPSFAPTVQTTFATGFAGTSGVAVDAAGDVFVADFGNNVVKKILPNGSVQTIGSGFILLEGVAVDAAGDVFVADLGNSAVKKILRGGGVQTIGSGFNSPAAVAVDAAGNVYVGDPGLNAVEKIPAGGGAIQALGSGFNEPYGVAVDAAGDVFVADIGNNTVKKILPNGDIQTLGSGFNSPDGVAVDAAGDVFVADFGNNAVKEILPDGHILTLGSGFHHPYGVAVDAAGDVFVADFSNNRIVKLSPTSLAAAPSPVSGSTTTAVSANLTGLTPGTTYFYRTVASSSGVGMAADSQQPPQSFTTPASQGAFALTEDIYVIGSGTVSVSAADGVLANDSPPGQLTVAAGAATGANGGTFTFAADGSFTYSPPANFPGFDSAQYTASDGQGHTAQAAVNVLSQTGGVVWKFYESVLHRDPDPGGLQYWINDFLHGGQTGDIAVGFFESDELLNEIITVYYQQFLLRTPDDSGLAYWRKVWHATGGPEIIKAGFADSPEFYTSAGGTPEAWITELYHRILNREPDPQGKQYWLNVLSSQGNTSEARKQIALGFFTSLEAYQGDVTGWFQEYLQRAPTASELNQYAGEMQAGKTDRDIEQEITNLPEYGQNPPAALPGKGVRLPNYLP